MPSRRSSPTPHTSSSPPTSCSPTLSTPQPAASSTAFSASLSPSNLPATSSSVATTSPSTASLPKPPITAFSPTNGLLQSLTNFDLMVRGRKFSLYSNSKPEFFLNHAIAVTCILANFSISRVIEDCPCKVIVIPGAEYDLGVQLREHDLS